MSSVDVRLVTAEEVERRRPDELATLLKDPDAGVVWVDVTNWDGDASDLLAEIFGLHPRAVQDCAQRNPVPKLHVYPDQVFVVLHAPERGRRGHVHYIELDQFIGPHHLITVHGPLNPVVPAEAGMVETRAVCRRLETGRLHVSSSHQLSFALVTALTGRLRDYLSALTEEVWELERAVTAGHHGDAERRLESMFQVRHGLLAVRTMAALSREVYGRMATLGVFGPGPGNNLLTDIEDQFRRLRTMADGQREYLQGVIEFYQTSTHTKMTIAAERLAVIAAVTLPITAISSVMGMNVIVNDSTQVGPLLWLLAGMALLSTLLLVWARRKGWW